MNIYTAWAGLQFLLIVTVIVISIWRAMMHVFALVETGIKKGLDLAIGRGKRR